MLPKNRPPTHPGEILARFFKTTSQFWMNLQTQDDLWFAERDLGHA